MKTFKSFRRARAFTLIELLIVILIIGILAAVIVPQLFSRADEARRTKALDDIATLSKCIQTFRLDTGRYPSSDEGLNALLVDPGDTTGWKGPYTTNGIPNDPWDMPYMYQYPGLNGNEESFTIMSYGKDKVEGGEGDGEDIIHGGQ